MQTGNGPHQLSPLVADTAKQLPGATEHLDLLETMVSQSPAAKRSPLTAIASAPRAPLPFALGAGEKKWHRPSDANGTGDGMPTKAAMDFMPVSGGKRRQSVAAGAGSQVNAASALKRAANKTGTAAVFSMRALAAMASKQEAPSKEQINNPSSGLEVWEYDGAKLNTKSVSCDQSSAYLTNMVKTCNAEFDEREVRNNTGGEEDLESGTLDNTDRPNEVCCRWIHMRGINFEVMDEIGRHLHLGDELVDECKAVASKPSVSWQQPSADMRCARTPRLKGQPAATPPRPRTQRLQGQPGAHPAPGWSQPRLPRSQTCHTPGLGPCSDPHRSLQIRPPLHRSALPAPVRRRFDGLGGAGVRV